MTPKTRKEALQAAGVVALMVLVVLVFAFLMRPAHAHDDGQWGEVDPAAREWFQGLMQPDAPTASCCGEADAYWCDKYFARGDKAFCVIDDDRPDAPRNRPHRDVGIEIEIPPNKLKWDRGNPTGHGIVFLSRAGFVFCYVQPSGT